MADLNLTELRKVAEAATPGPWEVLAYDSGLSYRELNAVVITEDLGDRICDTDAPSHGYDGPHAAEGLDARHIATFDPPTVLALLDRVAELEGTVARVEALAEVGERDGRGNARDLSARLRAALTGDCGE